MCCTVFAESTGFSFCEPIRQAYFRRIVKAQGGAELGKSIWLVGEEKRVVIDVEGERQAAGSESAGKEVEVSQESLAWVEAHEGEKAAMLVEQFEQRRL